MDSTLLLTGDVYKHVIRLHHSHAHRLTRCTFRSASKDALNRLIARSALRLETTNGNSQLNERPGCIWTVVAIPVTLVSYYRLRWPPTLTWYTRIACLSFSTSPMISWESRVLSRTLAIFPFSSNACDRASMSSNDLSWGIRLGWMIISNAIRTLSVANVSRPPRDRRRGSPLPM